MPEKLEEITQKTYSFPYIESDFDRDYLSAGWDQTVTVKNGEIVSVRYSKALDSEIVEEMMEASRKGNIKLNDIELLLLIFQDTSNQSCDIGFFKRILRYFKERHDRKYLL